MQNLPLLHSLPVEDAFFGEKLRPVRLTGSVPCSPGGSGPTRCPRSARLESGHRRPRKALASRFRREDPESPALAREERFGQL